MLLWSGLVAAAWIAVENTGEYTRVDISPAQNIVTLLEETPPPSGGMWPSSVLCFFYLGFVRSSEEAGCDIEIRIRSTRNKYGV